jgi:putative membrane protein
MMYGFGRFAYGHGASLLSWLGPIAMVAFWALFVAAMVTLIVYLARHGKRMGHHGTAIAILEERYAKGEISKEEFTEKRKDLL